MNVAASAPRFPWKRYAVLLVVIILLALLPLISVFTVYAIADVTGCRVDEARSYPCPVKGVDIGDALAFGGIFGWLALVTLPFGVVALGLWLAALLIHLAIGHMRARKDPAAP